MSLAVLTLVALVAALVLSMTSRVNVGWLALAFAWLIGAYGGIRADAVMAGFPVTLFLTLTGVALLFAVAETNGALEWLVVRLLPGTGGGARVLPAAFFVVAALVSSVGPGAISSVALLAPLTMALGARAGVSALTTALMVTNGANAGNLSPFSTVGIIANGAMARAGLGGHAARVWFANFAAHAIVSAAAYYWLVRSTRPEAAGVAADAGPRQAAAVTLPAGRGPSTGAQRLTLAVIVLWILAVVGFQASLGLSAFAAASLLLVAGAGEDAAAVRRVPWGVVLMVSGVTTLVALLEKTGGMELFTALLARLASPGTLNGVIALVTGAISTYSSTSGVVLPTFLPTVPSLVARVGGGDPLAVALSINVGSSLVDVSPLSTLGALCVAAVVRPDEGRRLFRALLIWGVSMIVVGAVLCQLLAGWLARV